MYSVDRYRRSGKRKNRLIIIGIVITLVLFLVAIYVWAGMYFTKHFFPKTTINGVDVGRMGVQDSIEALGDTTQSYSVTVCTRDGSQYLINGDEFSYKYRKQGSVAEFLESQNGFAWIVQAFKEHNYNITTVVDYSEETLKNVFSQLDCFDENLIDYPQDAKIVKQKGKLTVVEEVQGNQLIYEDALGYLCSAVKEGKRRVEFPDECYVSPLVTADSEEIRKVMDEVEKYYKSSITYLIGAEKEILDSETISTWIEMDENYNISINKEKVAEYAQSLASKYNTYADRRKFKTTKGDVIEIGGGDYGWVVDKGKEAGQIIEDIKSGTAVEREMIYSQVARVPGLNDIGNTYVEVDYSNQHMYYYKEGKLVLESDFVSGNLKTSNGSPDGVYKIIYKQSPATLVGENYSSDVTYFMVFAYNVGFHDATWRNKFGGNIYKTSGSHGCINLPVSFAKKLYEKLETDTPVIAYYREKVVLTAENAKISNAFSYKDPKKK